MSLAEEYAKPRHRGAVAKGDNAQPAEQLRSLIDRHRGKLTAQQLARVGDAMHGVAVETNDWNRTLTVATVLCVGFDAWNSKRKAAAPKPAEPVAPIAPTVDGPTRGHQPLTEKERLLVNWFRPPTAKRRGTALSIADVLNYRIWLIAEPHHKPSGWRGRGTVEALYGRTKWFRTQHTWSAIRTALDDPTSKLSKELSAERWQQISAVVDGLL